MNNRFLDQVASFIKIAVETNQQMSEDLHSQLYDLRKQAAVRDLDYEKYKCALSKTANTLYDTDFLSGVEEKRAFIKKASEDPVYVLRVLEKVCEAADVGQIGRPARVASKPKQAAEDFDPIMDICFGSRGNGDVLDL